MTLLELVSKLNTENINVVVIDCVTEETIIEFKSQGIAGVEGDVSAREVKKWNVNTSAYAISISVVLEASN